MVLRAEQQDHLREAAFSNDETLRMQHAGVVRWLEEWLSGNLIERYAEQARQRLAAEEKPKVGVPTGGSEFMESDGMDAEG